MLGETLEEYGTWSPIPIPLNRGVWYMVPYSYTCTEEYGTWSPIPIPVQRSMVHGPLFLYLYRGVWYSMGHKKVPVFRNTLPCNGNFAFRVRFPVPFYNFPCFYCCVSILKVRRKERLKNGKKNGAKTVQRSVFFPLRFFLTIVHLCLYLDKNFEIPR